ncbi:ankyrin repeat protein [Phlyctema vagabunda]|uniref:Ankyrin repeat protein n=1 Tax=Phlyctema vagabunda TaxID=108571 RepID=A0ABR4P5I1_9HELO
MDRTSSLRDHSISDVAAYDNSRFHIGDVDNYADNLTAERRRKREKCIRALLVTDPYEDRRNIINTKGKRAKGTCEWILGSSIFQSWLDSTDSVHQGLWLSGGPGKGKTMMAVFLAEELHRRTDPYDGDIVIELYCDDKIKGRNMGSDILRGLLFRILDQSTSLFPSEKNKDTLYEHLLSEMENWSSDAFTSVPRLWKILHQTLDNPHFKCVYCVLDALDECESASASAFISELKEYMANATRNKLKPIITSREVPNTLPQQLRNFWRIRLDPDMDNEVSNDIQIYIAAKMDDKYHGQPQEWRQKIQEELIARAEGTFLWAGFAIEMLLPLAQSEILPALREMPPGLDTMYDRMILQIGKGLAPNLSIARQTKAASLLRWIALAMKPLSLQELFIAIHAEVSDGLTKEQVVLDHASFCGHLLVIRDNRIQLVHQSLKDYLLRDQQAGDSTLEMFRIKPAAAHKEIAEGCVPFLEENICDMITDDFHLRRGIEAASLSYPFVYWPEHALQASWSPPDVRRPFFMEETSIWSRYVHFFQRFDQRKSQIPLDVDVGDSLLMVISRYNMTSLMQAILDNTTDSSKKLAMINRVNSDGLSPMWFALSHGLSINPSTTLGILIKHGGDLRITWWPCVLDDWDSYDRMRRLTFLLEHGVDINLRNKDGRTALSCLMISLFLDLDLVKLLLAYGADVMTRDGRGRTALMLLIQESGYSIDEISEALGLLARRGGRY